VAGLRRLAEDQGSTLFMVLLAALQAVLHRYTGQEDIRVGVPVANRHHAGLAGVVGFFVNTQVHRNHVTGRSRLADVLARTRLAALDAHANPDLPFEQLVEALQPERSLAHAPLFQVLFNHLHEDFRAFEAATGLAVQSEALDGQAAQFELTVEVRERAGGAVVVRLVHARELFEPATIAQLAGHFDTMLQAFEAQPQQAVGDVVLLSPAEQAVLSAWDTNTGATAPAGTVHALFEAQVARSPSAPAVVFGETGLTYAELDARANRLAHMLVDRGVSPETRVGVAMTRSIEMVVALLAVMKAGGAYVPIDPEHPADRIAYMLDDSAVPLLLTQRHLPRPAHRVAVLDVDALDLSTGPAHAPRVAVHGENLVYVIYTSGSTGRPKGAANRHRGLCNRLAWGQRHQPLDGTDTVLQKTPFGFDISFWEFFWPLTVGARLVLAAPGDHRDPARLVDLIEHHGVSTVHFVPSMLQAFVSHPGAGVCQRVRRIVCSGEALSAELQDRTLAMFPHATLLNLYGPTEASIEATFWDCRTDGASTVPIGRPIAGLQARVLDADFNAAPRGVAGELLLGGMGLARGYWNRPALTAERFVADPAGRAGERLYRTGDLVRWRADGQVEYLGRIDHQVKVRGFRIELGEVEAALLALPGVREAVVVAPDGTRLVAYVGADEGPGSEAAHLKAQLGLSLPDYMVPSVFVRLDRLPLNTNGKVDRKALPDPGATSAPAYVAPQGALAEGIAVLWAEVLQRDRVGQTDNFFDLGGHSLLLIRVHGLLKERLGVVLPVVDLFQHPTVGALACHIGNGPAAAVPADRRAERQRDALRRRRLSTERTRA
jgi:amino acid adenylation domain-containing protein